MRLSQSEMKKQAAILVFSELRSDARVQRQILKLAVEYRLTVFALGGFDGMPDDARLVQIHPSRSFFGRIVRGLAGLLGLHELAFWSIATVRGTVQALQGVNRGDFAFWVANDIETLPIALRSCGGAPVWFDAHEYSPRESEELLRWRLLHQPLKKYLCKKYIPLCSGMSTVSEGIAQAYQELAGKKSIVVLNAPGYRKLKAAPVIRGNRIRLVHHGVATPSRGLEIMLQAVQRLESEGDHRYEAHFFLLANSADSIRYLGELQRQAENSAFVKFHSPVPPQQLCDTLSEFDIGVISIPPVNFNSVHCLPNKFFDFIQARIPVMSGPLVEIEAWVKSRNLGWITKGFSVEAFVDSLRNLDLEQLAEKKIALEAAAFECSSEHSLARFDEAVARMLNSEAHAGSLELC